MINTWDMLVELQQYEYNTHTHDVIIHSPYVPDDTIIYFYKLYKTQRYFHLRRLLQDANCY